MSDPRIRVIKIKTGIVKRLAKEKITYEKESEQQRQRIEKFKEQGKDSHDIRKQEEVLQESLMMIPNCQRSLVKAYNELKKILETENDLKETESYLEAQKILDESSTQLPKDGDHLNF